MALPLQFDPFNFALNVVLVMVILVDHYVARTARTERHIASDREEGHGPARVSDAGTVQTQRGADIYYHARIAQAEALAPAADQTGPRPQQSGFPGDALPTSTRPSPATSSLDLTDPKTVLDVKAS
ncbi:hypothetical protein LTR53_001963 [Teratosphaeriaceae sp. CCFEE 6253]|nr:hypothetical protein LTR53_001963 [Teratosphaeriaceae sp. CCFEE 6253]